MPSEGEGSGRSAPPHGGTRRLEERAEALLAERSRAGLLRAAHVRSPCVESPPWVVIEGRRLLGFASNDYLGLARHPRVVAAARAALDRHGAGASAATLLGGRTELHEALEAAMAAWLRQEAALVMPSGYQANLAAQSLAVRRGRVVLHDRLNHASLLEASVLARARIRRFRHADAAHGAALLAAVPADLLVTESLFGMDGDSAPLAALGSLAAEHRVPLLVDEAHAIGVLGPEGAGLAAALPPGRGASLVVATLGKALGSQGACIVGSASCIEALRQTAPAAVYTTALAPAAVAAALEAIACIRDEPERRAMLQQKVQHFRVRVAGFAQLSADPVGPVVCLHLGEPQLAARVSAQLADRGFRVPAIRPPTVPAGTARLRISLSAAHTTDHLDALADALEACWPCDVPPLPEPGAEARVD